MKNLRVPLALILALLLPACGGKKSTTVVNNFTTTIGTTSSSPFTVIGVTSGDPSGLDEGGGVGALGADGQPRSVFVFNSGTTTQIRFARRNPDGTWTAPLQVSTNDSDEKVSIVVLISPINQFVHLFWLQGANANVYQLHYAQINNAATPAFTVPDIIMSNASATTNVGGGATFGRVGLTYATALEAATSNIYVAWTQVITDGGVQTEVPLVGAILAGAGILTERFALVSPTAAVSNTGANAPVLRAAGSGRVHALWASVNQVFHRLRTAVGTWSSGPSGNQISSAVSSNGVFKTELLLAADGDVYAAWLNPDGLLRAAYRPVGDATVFGSEVILSSSGSASFKFAAVLEPVTEDLHLFAGDLQTGNPGSLKTYRVLGPNLVGPVESETIFSVISTTTQVMDYVAWADSSSRVVVACLMPASPGEASIVRARIRPSGAGTGNYSTPLVLTATGPLPCQDLAMGKDDSGNAIIGWSQGSPHTIPLADIYGTVYSSGGTFSASFNVSQTPGTGSHGPIFALLADSGTGYFSWEESITVGDAHAVYFALKP